jgi:two-component system, LytTR family, sensor kinase
VLTLSVVNWPTLESVPSSVETAKLVIRSSLFEQFWMYSSMVTAILAIQHYQQFRQRERREAELKRQMAEYELQVLKLQLHPHFLFNTLNGIATLMLRDVKAARDMLVRLSELLRIALARSADNEVSLRDELEFVKAYLELEKMRFGERLIVLLGIEPATLDAQVPNMIIQPLVENAIQYGIAQVRGGGTIMLETARQGGRLRIRIVNDGPLSANGPHPMKGSGIGLGNTRARLGHLYGEDYRLQIMSRPEGGVELHLQIPFHGSARTAEREA